MKTIDANTGLLMKEGMVFNNIMGKVRVVKIIPGLTDASLVYDVSTDGGSTWTRHKSPLQVRWTHPAFFLQHVAFWPT